MDRNSLKWIAGAAMLIDHLGAIFYPRLGDLALLFRLVGRLTAPIMCFFLAEGFCRSRNLGRYLLRLLLFALLAQPAYSLFHGDGLWSWNLNMLFTLALSLGMLWCLEGIKQTLLRWGAAAALMGLSWFCDWPLIGPLWVLLFYLFREDREKQLLAFSLAALLAVPLFAVRDVLNGYLWQGELLQLGTLMALPLLRAYNGERGRGGGFAKWFFYVLYPAHLYLYVWMARCL